LLLQTGLQLKQEQQMGYKGHLVCKFVTQAIEEVLCAKVGRLFIGWGMGESSSKCVYRYIFNSIH